MYNYLDSHFKRKFDALNKTVVFTTSETLNDRFSPSPTTRYFIVNNGYTAVNKNNFAERVAFKNRSSMDIHKRFSLYHQGNLKLIELESKNRIAEIGNIRRIVRKPRKWLDDESAEYYNEEYEKPGVFLPARYNVMPLAIPSEVHTSTDSRCYEFIQSEQSDGSAYKLSRNSFTFEGYPAKRTWDGRVKGKDVATDDYRSKDYEGSEPIIYNPRTSFKKKLDTQRATYTERRERYQRSVFKWKRGSVTKEELDEELDRYMADAKLKHTSIPPAKDDVDPFVREYMIETEKSLKKNASDNSE